MKNLLLVLCCVSLVGCANARFASNDTQCKRNPAVDGLGVAALTGLPFVMVATPPIGIGVAAIMGGSYYVTHEALCR
jgi:hypothetical protein